MPRSTPEGTFLVDRLNAPFVAGQAARPPDPLIGVVAVVVVLFVLPMLGLNLVVGVAWLDASSLSASLVLITLVTLAVDVLLFGAAWWFSRRFALRRRGQLLPGRLTQVEGDVRPGPQGSVFVLTVTYVLVSPTSGGELTGTIAQIRDDLVEAPLPPVGTPVAVLYLNDGNFRVM